MVNKDLDDLLQIRMAKADYDKSWHECRALLASDLLALTADAQGIDSAIRPKGPRPAARGARPSAVRNPDAARAVLHGVFGAHTSACGP